MLLRCAAMTTPMLRSLRLFGFVIVGVALLVQSAGATVIADLSTDWSDSSNPNTGNPNGTWQYRQGTTILPSVPSWTAAGTVPFVNQPAWAPSDTAGNFLPAEFKATAATALTFSPGN